MGTGAKREGWDFRGCWDGDEEEWLGFEGMLGWG
jgi:hypothetical protein